MNRLLKTAVLGLAVAATTLSALPSAQAGDGWRYRHNRYDSGDMVAAGVLGLAVGAIAGAATAAPRYYEPEPLYGEPVYAEPVYREPVYREPVYRERVYREVRPSRRYYAAAPAYAGGLEPWSQEWYDYCESRYRSFNERTGTYTGYDGVKRFCQAN